MNKMQKFEFEGNEITFLTGENVMVNATEMAKQFDVQPAFWLRTDPAKRMIEAISAMHGCIPTDLVVVRNGGNDFGTWMHRDVALPFAQWLSPELYLWCNDRIFELFENGITALQKETREELFTLWEACGKLKNNGVCTIGRHKIYELMRTRGILDENNKPNHEYIERGYFKLVPYGENPYVKHVVMEKEGFKWLNQTLFPDQLVDYNERLEKIESYVHLAFNEVHLALEGIYAMGETILIGKSTGPNHEEQNRVMTANLRTTMDRIKTCIQAVAVIKE